MILFLSCTFLNCLSCLLKLTILSNFLAPWTDMVSALASALNTSSLSCTSSSSSKSICLWSWISFLFSSSEFCDLIFLMWACWVGVGVLSADPPCFFSFCEFVPSFAVGGTKLLGLAGADLSSFSWMRTIEKTENILDLRQKIHKVYGIE